jgi:hypothetical protein
MNTNKLAVVPRPDVSFFILEIPYLKGKALRAAVRNQLIGLFPENPDDYIIEIKRNKNKKSSYLVFALPANRYAEPVAASTLLVQSRLPNRDASAVYVGDAWVEYITIERGCVTKSAVKKRPADLSGEFLIRDKDAEITGGPENRPVDVFCYLNDKPLFDGNNSQGYKIHVVEKELLKADARKISLLNYLDPSYRRRKWLYLLLSLSAALAVFIFSSEYRANKAIEAQRERERQSLIEKKRSDELARVELLNDLRDKYSKLSASKRVAPYEIIELISRCLDADAHIVNATIRESFFQFEGEAPDALRVLKSFEDNGQIKGPALRQIYPFSGRERFIIDGSAVPRIETVSSDLPVEDQIVRLQRIIKELEDNKYGERAYAPSFFGAGVRALLRKWKCDINSYQYLNNEAGKEVEFSIRAESGNFFGFLQEAIRSNAGWYFVLIQIRNLSPQNALDIVFRTTGNIDVENDDDYVYPDKDGAVNFSPVSEITKNYYTPRPLVVAPPPPSPAPETSKIPDPPAPVRAVERNSRYEYLGLINDGEGNPFIYVKDTNGGGVLKLSPGTGDDLGYLDLNNGTFEIYLDGKIYELRRNK